MHFDMFQFISVSGSCYFFCILVPFRRDIEERKDHCFIQAPKVLKPGTWTNCRLIILYTNMLRMLLE